MLAPVPVQLLPRHFAGASMEARAVALAAEEGISELQAYRFLRDREFLARKFSR